MTGVLLMDAAEVLPRTEPGKAYLLYLIHFKQLVLTMKRKISLYCEQICIVQCHIMRVIILGTQWRNLVQQLKLKRVVAAAWAFFSIPTISFLTSSHIIGGDRLLYFPKQCRPERISRYSILSEILSFLWHLNKLQWTFWYLSLCATPSCFSPCTQESQRHLVWFLDGETGETDLPKTPNLPL